MTAPLVVGVPRELEEGEHAAHSPSGSIRSMSSGETAPGT